MVCYEHGQKDSENILLPVISRLPAGSFPRDADVTFGKNETSYIQTIFFLPKNRTVIVSRWIYHRLGDYFLYDAEYHKGNKCQILIELYAPTARHVSINGPPTRIERARYKRASGHRCATCTAVLKLNRAWYQMREMVCSPGSP